jgi:hypothetical protein
MNRLCQASSTPCPLWIGSNRKKERPPWTQEDVEEAFWRYTDYKDSLNVTAADPIGNEAAGRPGGLATEGF